MTNGPQKAALGDAPKQGVSLVMVSYMTGEVLFSALDAALAPDQEALLELILVDNGNPPQTLEELKRRAKTEPRLKIINGHGNVGFAQGCNIGVNAARGDCLLLLNPDCCLAPGALPALLAEAETLGDDWMLGCHVLDPDGSNQRGSRRALLTPLTALVETLRLDLLIPPLFRRHRLNLHDSPLPEKTSRIPVISGACMMLPAATFRKVNGLDKGYFLHVDDLDLCLRLHRAGTPVYYAPHVKAIHYTGSNRSKLLLAECHKAIGFLRYFWRHFHGPRWCLLLPPLTVCIVARLGIKTAWLLLYRLYNGREPQHGAQP